MRASKVILPVIRCLTFLSAAVAAFSAAHADGKDYSGTYEDEGSTVHILTGQKELFVSYSEKFNNQSCACLARAQDYGDGSYGFDDATDFLGALEVHDSGVVFKLTRTPRCCGSGWRGLPRFDADDPDPPTTCTVAAAQAHFYSYARDHKPQKRPAYVMKGDSVDVVPAPAGWGRDFWLARFVGPKKWTIGFIRRDDLSCVAKK
jgi:hypothetical protein